MDSFIAFTSCQFVEKRRVDKDAFVTRYWKFLAHGQFAGAVVGFARKCKHREGADRWRDLKRICWANQLYTIVKETIYSQCLQYKSPISFHILYRIVKGGFEDQKPQMGNNVGAVLMHVDLWSPNKVLVGVWKLKCWGPSALCIYRLKGFWRDAEHFITERHTHTQRFRPVLWMFDVLNWQTSNQS